MYPLTRSTSRSRFFGLPFSPSVLFAAGEQGAWYDPSDYSTLFQDVAGTTPVTGVEQFVRLMLDKSGRGNHATAPSDPARPILRARYNQLTYTEDLSNGSFWSATRASIANTSDTLAPNGTATADKVTVTSDGYCYVVRSIPATSCTLSCYFKAGTTSIVTLDTNGSSAADVAAFNLANQTVSVGANNVAASITPVGNGWFHCSVSRGATASTAIYIGKNDALTGQTFYFWGADLRVTNDALNMPAYQRVGAATDYDTNGFLPYLEFNGSTWSMSTAAIDFSGTDKMTVFAGVRKLSDANRGMVVELSDNANNSFQINAPSAVAPLDNFAFASRGSVFPGFAQASGYAAPISGVLTGIGEISTDTNILRVNGAQVATNTTDQGTGNYGSTYPLFIGSRNNASLWLNGRIYSLIIRGAASSASEIAATESWVNARTQAY